MVLFELVNKFDVVGSETLFGGSLFIVDFLTNFSGLEAFRREGKLIEAREYRTIHGPWTYFTADDGQMDLDKDDYLGIGTLESYEKLKEYFGEEEYYEFSIYSHLLHIFTLLARFELSRLRPFAGSSDLKRRDYFDRLGRSLEYISLHYNEAITLDDAAALSGFSRYHFSRLFKEYMECTFYDYLTDLRVKAAEAMLAGEDLPITEIALRSGFLSISTFNRTFRQKNGCTPKEYRDLYSGRRQVAAYELK